MNKELVESIKAAEAEAAAKLDAAKAAALKATDKARSAGAARTTKAYDDERLARYERVSKAAAEAEADASATVENGRGAIDRLTEKARSNMGAATAAVIERLGRK